MDETIRRATRKQVESEIQYVAPTLPERRCYICNFSEVTNAGALYPGLRCTKIRDRSKEKGVEYPNSQVEKAANCSLFENM